VAVDDDAVAVTDRARRQRGEVAPRPGLGEALAERELAARDRAEQPRFELGRCEALQRATDRLVREEVQREREPVIAEDVLDDRGVDVRQPTPAELFRPRPADPARLPERSGHLARVAVGEHPLAAPFGIALERRTQGLGERSGILAERTLSVGQPEVHARRC
jgi:hypothetical protein